MTHALPNEKIYVPENKKKLFGSLVTDAMATLPPSFCGPVRNPYTKRQSQYKGYEWMALIHWYIVPIGIELELDAAVLQNYSNFVEIVEFAMTIQPRSFDDVKSLHEIVKKFLMDFEKIYVGSDPEKISRVRLSIFQLIHVPRHIEWNGQVRVGSQATVERAIGEVGHKIHSKKAPFANLANIIFQEELTKLLLLYYPSLAPKSDKKSVHKQRLFSKMKISRGERNQNLELDKHIKVICKLLDIPYTAQLEVVRYGKFQFSSGHVLNSRLSETQGRQPQRSSRYFEGKRGVNVVFGEALSFYHIAEHSQSVVVCQPLRVSKILNCLRGNWHHDIQVLPVSSLHSLIGLFCSHDYVYVLRKHPGLISLNEEEKGLEESQEERELDGSDDEYD
jgi:hypothetical protein